MQTKSYFIPLIRLIIILTICLIATNVKAGTIEIEWDPPLEGEVVGYKVYYGKASGDYQYIEDVGLTTTTTLTDLEDCVTYYWAIKAYNSEDEESEEFSNEVSGWARPSVEIVEPSEAEQGEILDVVIKGANYADNPVIEIENSGIDILSVAQYGCHELAVTLQIGPEQRGQAADPIGSFDLTVINPDMVYGTKTEGFNTLLNKTRIDLDLSGRVDGMDLSRFALLFGLSNADMNFNPDCDFNGDGWIDGEDLSHLASNFGWIL
jgi:hypothetical protein